MKAIALAVGAMLMGAPAAGAAQSKDPRSERERVRKQAAEVAGQVDTLKADDEEVRRALGDLQANVAGQEVALDDARRAADQAARDAENARNQEREAVRQVEGLEGQVRTMAVEDFIRPPGIESVDILQSSRSIGVAARKEAMLELSTARDDDLLDQLRAARQDVEARRQEAENAAARAEEKKVEIAGQVKELQAAQAQKQEFASSLEQRIEAALAESSALAQLDQQLSGQIAAEQARLAAQLRTQQGEPRRGGGGGGGGSSGRSGRSSGPVGRITTVSVRGIQVSPQIADELEALMAAAEADGIVLRGGGYRDPSAQISTRRANCGSSNYALYEMPASQCSPPTARPGMSMHERGLAVDFTYNGSIISSRSSPAFQWLAGNASRFGFYNLPSEPWHWSTNGN